MKHCPLCCANSLNQYHEDKRRAYFQCSSCLLVSVPPEYRLSAENEKAEYDKHQNNPTDNGYRRFLERTVAPLLARVSKGATGLDFGCGPGPTISEMAKEQGFEVQNYDLYYFNQPELLEKRYDFVTMTEVIEHIAKPMPVLTKLNSLLNPSGILAVMTKRVQTPEAFKSWHYKNDPTHICFYSTRTFEWISKKMDWRLEIIDKDVVFFHKE
ncbi:class I SAM-dependent methyltransferase [Aliikangiella coralliicola]|uniref:Class I SAM-dependent methyltransferase n=1 Tax=Aliikangiella coralliicola TaxID=2592383 RepID=A0A545UEQ5_9GAMM|nr:class I SAM-dependent methyltransferase [Aliikangiella coralliicola]TQV87956.1 class I SAM-dependent methyltransferase [Aliikangiella coralliicola]